MSQPDQAIVIEHFTKRYGRHTAVDDLCLEIPAGSVFGLLGRNGSGKSTTFRALLNLIAPTSGRLTVLGLDAARDALAIRRRVGYVPEAPTGYGWMTVDECLAFNAAFHPSWDATLAGLLVARLDIPLGRRLDALSLGSRAKVGLVTALAPRPDLLLLDDPTSGLDVVVRREFLEAIIGHVQSEGGTVLFSSHMLHEMERVADAIAILRDGRLVVQAPLESLKSGTRRIRAVYPAGTPAAFPVSGLMHVDRSPHHAVLTVAGYEPSCEDDLRAAGASSVEVIDMSLEEIFVETVKGGRS